MGTKVGGLATADATAIDKRQGLVDGHVVDRIGSARSDDVRGIVQMWRYRGLEGDD